MQYELEQIVPTRDTLMPFIWVTGANFEVFEETVRASPLVEELCAQDRLGDTTLYRVEWTEEQIELLEIVSKTDATVLEATGSDVWRFRLRFLDPDRLSQSASYAADEEIPIHVVETSTQTEDTDWNHRFELTREQREALVLALERGYFATPRQVSLSELGDELGIAKQAVSGRIRRGEEEVLRKALSSSAVASDESSQDR